MMPDFDRFLRLLEQKKFFEAHEALEEYWFPRRFEEKNEVKLLKGLINAAVSFELIQRGRIKQSKKVWMNYLKYRQLLYKIDTPFYNEIHRCIREIDRLRRVYM